MMTYELKKNEHLCSRRIIETLVKTNNTFVCFPIRCKYTIIKSNVSEVKFLIAIPKRNFKKAVDRNHLKRLIREAYRLNKSIIYESSQQNSYTIYLMLYYMSNQIADYHFIEEKIKTVFLRLNKIINQDDIS